MEFSENTAHGFCTKATELKKNQKLQSWIFYFWVIKSTHFEVFVNK